MRYIRDWPLCKPKFSSAMSGEETVQPLGAYEFYARTQTVHASPSKRLVIPFPVGRVPPSV